MKKIKKTQNKRKPQFTPKKPCKTKTRPKNKNKNKQVIRKISKTKTNFPRRKTKKQNGKRRKTTKKQTTY